jgi:rhomboid protease GluP
LRDADQHQGPVRVRLTADGELAKAYVLTLTAMDMRAMLASEQGAYAVYVAPEDELRATWELDQYDSENATGAAAGKQARARPAFVVSFSTTALAYAAVLLFFFGAARRGSFGTDWAGEGAMVAHHVTSDFELWRTVTALTLHLDFGHIASNLVFGVIFVWLLAKETGPGIAWASTLLAGAAGNWLNALWQAPVHTSIGASTAVFGAVMLMAFLGFGEGNTDIGAHIGGFLAGLAGGYWMSRKDKAWFADDQRQIDALKLTGFVLTSAWALALMF